MLNTVTLKIPTLKTDPVIETAVALDVIQFLQDAQRQFTTLKFSLMAKYLASLIITKTILLKKGVT